MPLFFADRTARRKNTRTPSPTSNTVGGNSDSNGTSTHDTRRGTKLLRSRVFARNATHTTTTLLPMSRNNDKTSPTNNNFLLGGMYVPDKDKKRRIYRNSHNKGWSFPLGAVADCWQRLWHVSPLISILCAVLLAFAVWFFIVVPIVSLIFDRERDMAQRHRGGIDWLLTDTALLGRLPSAKNDRSRAERLATERDRLQKQHGETRQKALAALAHDWYHRNDLKKVEASKQQTTESRKVDVSAVTKQDEAATEADKSTKTPDSLHELGQPYENHVTHRRLVRTLQTMDSFPLSPVKILH